LATALGAALAGLPAMLPGMPNPVRSGIYATLASFACCGAIAAAVTAYRRRRSDGHAPRPGSAVAGTATSRSTSRATATSPSTAGVKSSNTSADGKTNTRTKTKSKTASGFASTLGSAWASTTGRKNGGAGDPLRVFTEASAAAVLFLRDGKIAYANAAAQGILGGSLIGEPFKRFVVSDHLGLLRLLEQTPDNGQTVTPRAELLVKSSNGHQQPRWMDVSLSPVEFEGRRVWSINAFDVHDRKLAENAHRESEGRVRDILESIQLAAVLLSADAEVLYVNPYMLELLVGKEEALVGRDWFTVVYPEDTRTSAAETFRERVRAGTLQPYEESEVLTGNGERRLIAWNNTLLRDFSGNVTGAAAIGSDITERRRMEQQLVHDALHDALTGLPNRVLFLDRLTTAIARHRRRGAQFAVLFLDLDRFKLVNDSLGHAFGDQLLIAVSRVLAGIVRPGDTVARLGGDEFTVLLEDITDLQDAVDIASRIREALTKPVVLGGHEVFVRTSVGIAGSELGHTNAEDMLRDADTAMYAAKASGDATHRVFDASMHTRAIRLLNLETSLRRAVDKQEFILHYQPIVDLSTMRVVGFEALLRWQHPERGLVMPGEFIRVAEDTRIILDIGRWAIDEVCRELESWDLPTDLRCTVSVNLSGRHFSQPDLIDQVTTAVTKHKISPGRLKIEITESVIMENAESAILTLQKLKELGTSVSIDDFGTGYSSLSYLLRFPADTLKLDRAFVAGLGKGGRHVQIVGAIVSLARGLGMDVVAEGVETTEQHARLNILGCSLGQGYLFGRPLDSKRARGLAGKHLAWNQGMLDSDSTPRLANDLTLEADTQRH
jgi:diguanylate cyclase (GGDEF)-like protein/PAS domain S-box-containing protein